VSIARRLAALEHLYGVYDRFCSTLDGLACRKFCDTCCSRNVTLTTLEGLYFLQELEPGRREDCLAILAGDRGHNRFRPHYTTNQIAALCREGHAPPEDAVDHDGSRCPFLADAACSLYPRRPFGCRCMLSRHPCGARGYAELDDWVLTVNTVFLQTIEHIDRPGGFGNLQDVLLALGPEERRAAYREGRPPLDAEGLIANQPAPMLMVPPEHRERIQPLLAEMQRGMAG
jgi:Fe-S-cluster containining protein